MSILLDLFGLNHTDFFITDNVALCGDDRKTFGQIKREEDGHFRITVGKDARDCNGPKRQV